MNNNSIDKRKSNKILSLYDYFKPGDRVIRNHLNKNGKLDEYKGIILSMNSKQLEIFWDIIDGKYQPNEIEVNFTNCSLDDIFKGSEKYSPIKREGYKYRPRFRSY